MLDETGKAYRERGPAVVGPDPVEGQLSFCGGGSNNFAIYAVGMTDLDVTLHVTDTQNTFTKDYHNSLGTAFTMIRDGPFTCP